MNSLIIIDLEVRYQRWIQSDSAAKSWCEKDDESLRRFFLRVAQACGMI